MPEEKKKTRRRKVGGFLAELIEGAMDASTAKPAGSGPGDFFGGLEAARNLPMIRAGKAAEILGRQDQASLREAQAGLATAKAGYETERAGLAREAEANKTEAAKQKQAGVDFRTKINAEAAARRLGGSFDEAGAFVPLERAGLTEPQKVGLTDTEQKEADRVEKRRLDAQAKGIDPETFEPLSEDRLPLAQRAALQKTRAETKRMDEWKELQDRALDIRSRAVDVAEMKAKRPAAPRLPSVATQAAFQERWSKAQKTLHTVRSRTAEIDALAATDISKWPEQIAVVQSYLRMVDDNAVREGEFRTAAAAGTVTQRAGAIINSITRGGKLDPSQVKDFINAAHTLNAAFELDFTEHVAPGYSMMADKLQFTPDEKSAMGFKPRPLRPPMAQKGFGRFRGPDGVVRPATTAQGAEAARKAGWAEVP